MAQIKFVYFDLGDVLFTWEDGLKNLAVIESRPYEEIFKVFINKYHDDACRGRTTPQYVWQNLKRDLNLNTELVDFADWWTDEFKPIQPMHELARETAKKYRIGLFTNLFKEVMAHSFKKGCIPNLNWEKIVQSSDLNLIKPDEAIFKYAEKTAGVLASEILFIENSPKNIDKAKELGWQVAWYDVANPRKSINKIRQTLGLNS
jgi:HAD superfamily hydrolase (TIGR01509 family)